MYALLLCSALVIGQAPDAAPPESAVRAPTEGSDSKPPAVAGWDNGFFLRSADQQFVLRITGQLQADFRGFANRGDITDFDTFLVRRARLGIEATAAQYYEFRLLPDFGQGTARIQDSYVNVHYWDQLQFEAGKFKQPFSYEQLIQDRFVPTMERSLIDQLVPQRDAGLMIHGQKLLGDRLDYAVAISDGVINGDLDTNPGKDLAWRVVVRPFNSEAFGPWLRGLQAGMAITTGVEGGLAPAILRTPGTVQFLGYLPAVREDGRRSRFGPELAYFWGPLGIVAQYLYETDQFRTSPARPRVTETINGYFAMATLLLTGETRTTYSAAIDPLRPFAIRHPLCNPGAWELVFRMSRLVLDPTALFAAGPDRLADPAVSSNGATELTLGMNWYLNKWVRTQLNWEYAWFDRPVRLGPGAAGLLTSQDTILLRFQVIF
ncbi:MAG: OprO/OprP family phosphate-selective porin [Gemmataceae bacterium]